MNRLASLPTPDGVLYAPPNPDGSAKRCGNCYLWNGQKRCAIHAAQVKVSTSHVCGYHLFGPPHEFTPTLTVEPISSKLSGLEKVGRGTHCGNCLFYSGGAHKGTCAAVVAVPHGPPAVVQFMGCCARWEKR